MRRSTRLLLGNYYFLKVFFASPGKCSVDELILRSKNSKKATGYRVLFSFFLPRFPVEISVLPPPLSEEFLLHNLQTS